MKFGDYLNRAQLASPGADPHCVKKPSGVNRPANPVPYTRSGSSDSYGLERLKHWIPFRKDERKAEGCEYEIHYRFTSKTLPAQSQYPGISPG